MLAHAAEYMEIPERERDAPHIARLQALLRTEATQARGHAADRLVAIIAK